MTETGDILARLRAEIDALDAELTPLLVRRFACVARVVSAKRAAGESLRDAARERVVLSAAKARAGAFAESVGRVYEAMFAETRGSGS